MKPCILLLEDNDFIRENTIEILELSGYEIIAAIDGIKGLELFHSRKPDLILCDIQMPGMNGYEFFTTITADKTASSIPFIFLTAYSEKSEVAKALEMGAAGYIIKPFDADDLVSLIKKHLSSLAAS